MYKIGQTVLFASVLCEIVDIVQDKVKLRILSTDIYVNVHTLCLKKQHLFAGGSV